MEGQTLCFPEYTRTAAESDLECHIRLRKKSQDSRRQKRTRFNYDFPVNVAVGSTIITPDFQGKEIPQELLIDVFRCVDLSSRVKLRGVSTYWKHLVSKPEVNAILNISTDVFGGALGLWRGTDYRLEHDELPAYASWILGDHIRMINYNGHGLDRKAPDCCVISQQMAWLRLRAPQVKQILVQNVVFRCWPEYQEQVVNTQVFVVNRIWSDLFGIDQLALETMTLRDCQLLYSLKTPLMAERYAAIRDKFYKWIVPLEKVTINWQGDRMENIRQALSPYIWPFPDPEEQIEWVAKYTPLLPHHCDGPLSPLDATRESETGEHVDLNMLNYHSMDKATLVFFARVIMSKKNNDGSPMFPAPPFSFPENFMLLEDQD